MEHKSPLCNKAWQSNEKSKQMFQLSVCLQLLTKLFSIIRLWYENISNMCLYQNKNTMLRVPANFYCLEAVYHLYIFTVILFFWLIPAVYLLAIYCFSVSLPVHGQKIKKWKVKICPSGNFNISVKGLMREDEDNVQNELIWIVRESQLF